MSYILDALKKAEKERQKGNIPGILTTHDVVLKEARSYPILPYLFIALLLISCIFLFFLIFHSKKISNISNIKNLEINLKSNSAEVIENNKKSNITITSSVKPPDKTSKESATELTKNLPSIQIEPSAINNKPESRSETETKSIVDKKIYQLNELPSSLQQMLPPFSISVHIYSEEPASRFIKINGISLREGQDLTHGLRVQEITKDGVIFHYQNYLFFIGLKQD